MLLPIAASDRPPVHTLQPVRRAAQADSPAPVRQAHEAGAAYAVAAGQAATGPLPANPDILRDQYADDRLHRAVQAFEAADGALPPCHGAAWGSVACLQPFQPYFFVHGNPPFDTGNAPVPARPRQLAVTRASNATLDEGFESTRQRRRAP